MPSNQGSAAGLQGEYDHYRTIALQDTTERAVSLWTADCVTWIKNSVGYPVEPGDFGENILVQVLTFDGLEPGYQLQFLGKEASSNDYDDEPPVVLEITETVVPCGSLWELPYINDESLTPSKRVHHCQDCLEQLAQLPGRRGWYAKLITTRCVACK